MNVKTNPVQHKQNLWNLVDYPISNQNKASINTAAYNSSTVLTQNSKIRSTSRIFKERKMYKQIMKENKMLLGKIIKIHSRPMCFSINKNSISSALTKESLNKHKRLNDLKRITKENRKFLRRLITTPSVYDVVKWENDNARRKISSSSSRNLHSRQNEPVRAQYSNIRIIRSLKTSESARQFSRKDRLLSESRIRSLI